MKSLHYKWPSTAQRICLKPILGHACVFCYLFQASHEEVHNHTMYAITHLE